jgi:hypothetical protein
MESLSKVKYIHMRKGRGEITKLSSLFEKYTKLLKAPQGVVVDAFREVVQDVLNLDIPKEKITYTVRSRTLSVAVFGPRKSEIQLHKREIISHLKGRLGEQSAPLEII